MTQTCEDPVAGVAAGPSETFRLATERLDNAPKSGTAQIEFCNPRAVREPRLELLRESIFENLGAAGLLNCPGPGHGAMKAASIRSARGYGPRKPRGSSSSTF